MSKYFDLVKKNYINGFWSESKVRDAVDKSWITKDEFQSIVGKPY